MAEDYEAELAKEETSSNLEKNYELPGGQVITIGAERQRERGHRPAGVRVDYGLRRGHQA